MKAWVVNRPGPVATAPLQLADKPVPVPGRADEALADLAAGRYSGAAVLQMRS